MTGAWDAQERMAFEDYQERPLHDKFHSVPSVVLGGFLAFLLFAGMTWMAYTSGHDLAAGGLGMLALWMGDSLLAKVSSRWTTLSDRIRDRRYTAGVKWP